MAPDYSKSSPEDVLTQLQTSNAGLSETDVLKRQTQYGPNSIHKKNINILLVFARQFTNNPLISVLVAATAISYFLGQDNSSYYIFAIVMASVLLGLWNEYAAEKTVDNLLKKISPTALVIRNNEKIEVPASQLTIGDIVLLSQGCIIPADMRCIETKDIEVNQSVLTGETKTIFKTSEKITTTSPNPANMGYMGTTVESGIGKGVVTTIGKNTQFGNIAESVSFIRPTTDFQKGLADFGNLIVKVILLMTLAIFAVNFMLGHELLNSLLFSLAIAVGLTPELLPVIVTVSLSHGAGKLAKKHIVAKQLIAIENLGNMDILCTDKTGTLTEGNITVVNALNSTGEKSSVVLELGLLCNSAIVHHKILGNAIDVSLWEYATKQKIAVDKTMLKIDEEPFNYDRKAMFTVVAKKGALRAHTLIAKGAPGVILALCARNKNKQKLHETLQRLNKDGLRIVAVATKKVSQKESYSWDDVKDLTFAGYISFLDVPKKTAKEALEKLHNLHVATKIITGDNEIITQKICAEIGITIQKTIVGTELDTLTDEQLLQTINTIDIFARVTPQQKLRIIQVLQKQGHTVGYMGDGINDIPALHAADVGISVNTAVDVAKQTASIVLLRKSLDVVADGVVEGRRTFNNTMKYILMAVSSNFGNMFSAAGASFFLPFLPMTPVQILLTNGLYDISQTSIPSDNVDAESLIKPRHWNINFIKNYMIFFGPISSVFDFLTFGVMFFFFHAQGALFQTGWFIESVATEILVVFVIRTARTPFFLSRPSFWLLTTCTAITTVGIILPFTTIGKTLGFVTPPLAYFGILIILVGAYLMLVEVVKNIFLKKYAL